MDTPHPSRPSRDARRDDARFRVLHAVDTRPGLSQRDLATAAGVSLGAANALLNGLIADGLVELGAPRSATARLRFDYLLTRAGRTELRRLSGPYLARRRADLRALEDEISSLTADVEAGRGAR